MSELKTQIMVWSNNYLLEKLFLSYKNNQNVKFVSEKKTYPEKYVIITIDLTGNLEGVSQKLIELYHESKTKNRKICVVILHGDKIDSEKNVYFDKLLKDLSTENPIHRLIIVKDLFQDSIDPVTPLDKLINTYFVDQIIRISKKGENTIYPLFFDSFVEGLLKTLFLNNTNGKTFWFIGDQIRDLELAYLIKKYTDDLEGYGLEIDAIEPDYQPNNNIVSLSNKTRIELNWEPSEEFDSILKTKINNLIGHASEIKKSSETNHSDKNNPIKKKLSKLVNKLIFIKNIITKKDNTKKVNLRSVLETTILSILGGYLITLIMYGFFIFLSLKTLDISVSQMRKGNVPASVSYLQTSKTSFEIGESCVSIVKFPVSIINPSYLIKMHNLNTFIRYAQGSINNLQQIYVLGNKAYASLNSEKLQNYEDLSLALKSNLSLLFENISQLEILSKSGQLPLIVEKEINKNSEFSNLPKIEIQVSELIKTIDLMPKILAGDSTKNIGILMQNTQELRPTGGAVEFLILLTVEKGQLKLQKTYTSEEIDALSVGVIKAPPLIKNITGTDDWKFRDSNYNPDFTQSSINIAWMIEKNLKTKVDFLISINERTLKSVLKESGPIVVDGNQITAEELDNSIIQGNLSIYRSLTEKIINSVINHELSLLTVARVISAEMGDNNMYLWSADSLVEKTIVNQDYSGAILPHGCHSALQSTIKCSSNTFYLNESNYSQVTLGNSLERKVNHKIILQRDATKHSYLINYHFTRPIPDLNRSLYLIYQIYTPTNSNIDGVVIDNILYDIKDHIKQTDNTIDRYQIPVSFTFNQDHKVEINFTVKTNEPASLPFSYSITELKQPGTTDKEFGISIFYPENAYPSAVTSEIKTTPTSIEYQLPPRNATLGVTFMPQIR